MDFNFLKPAKYFFMISAALTIISIGLALYPGPRLSIEFTGGTLIEASYAQAPDLNKLRKQMEADGFTDTQVQNFGTSRDVLIRVPLSKDAETSKVGERVMASLAKVGADGTARAW